MINKIKRVISFIEDIQKNLNFEKNHGSFKGVYKNFDEATKGLKNKPIGYDNNEVANEYLKNFDSRKISEYEYPLFFWLNQILSKTNQSKSVIFDFGGNLGVHYFKFKEYYINKNFQWLVCEVEALCKVGKDKFENDRLKFTTNFEEANNSDIFFSSGAIQYVENFSLSKLPNKPKHILLSRLPMQDNIKQFVTLQNTSSSFSPQYVFNRKDFISSLENIGYELIDTWRGYDSCYIPFHKNKSIRYYTGFYFKLKEVLQ